MEFLLREMVPEDEGFIYNCWLKSYYNDGYCTAIPKTVYFKNEARLIDHTRANGKVLCTVFPEDPAEIVAFLGYEYVEDALVIHWMYTRLSMRAKGLASNMVKAVLGERKLIIGTHLTRSYHFIKRGLQLATGAHVIYDPYLIPSIRTLHAAVNS